MIDRSPRRPATAMTSRNPLRLPPDLHPHVAPLIFYVLSARRRALPCDTQNVTRLQTHTHTHTQLHAYTNTHAQTGVSVSPLKAAHLMTAWSRTTACHQGPAFTPSAGFGHFKYFQSTFVLEKVRKNIEKLHKNIEKLQIIPIR